jgi:hypothetical protein
MKRILWALGALSLVMYAIGMSKLDSSSELYIAAQSIVWLNLGLYALNKYHDY